MNSKSTSHLCRWAALLVIGLLVQACDRVTPEERLQRAADLASEGRHQAAIVELRSALQRDPELAEARKQLGLVFLDVGDYLSAVAELERAERLGVRGSELEEPLAEARSGSGEERHARRVIADHGDTPAEELSVSLTASLGRALQTVGRSDAAYTLLSGLVQRVPESVEGRLALARLEWARGQIDAALGHARAAETHAPEEQEPALVLGELLLATGDAAAAQDAFTRALELGGRRGGNLAFARLGLARALVATNRFAEARPLLEQVLQEVPNLPAARYLLALTQLEADELEAARDSLEQVIRDVPDHLASRYFRGLIYFREGRFERARDDLERVVARTPQNLQARLLLAAVHSQEDAHDRAVNVLRGGLQIPDVEPDAAYYAALGQSLLRTGRQSEGLEMLTRAAARAPDAAGIRTQLAMAYMATGAQGSAEAELKEVVDLSESFPLSDALLILVQLEAQRYDEALASAQRFVERNPEAPMALNMLGAVQLAREDDAAAREAFLAALQLDEAFAPAALNLAELERSAGDLDAARKRLEGVVQQEPRNASARQRLADVLRDQGDHDEAARVLAELGSDGEVSEQVLAARAQSYLQAGRLDEAVAALEEVLRRRPGDEQVALGLAGALAGAGQRERSLELLDHHVRDPAAAPLPIHTLYADLLISAGRLDHAQSVLTALRGRDGGGFGYALLSGDLALAHNDLDRAIDHYKRAHAAQPSSDTMRRLQSARVRAGRAAEGRADLEAWLEANPDDGRARGMLAELRLDTQEYDDAIRDYEALREQFPDNVVVLNNLAWLYGETGHPDAVPTARRALELAPDLAPVQDTLGWLLVRSGNAEEGLLLLRKAAEARPEDPQILYHYGVALERTGARDEARATLRRALGTGEFDQAAEARALLERLGG